MNCTIWNAQGAGSSGFQRACRYLLNKFKTDVLVLMETRVSGAQAQDVCTSLGFSDNFRVEAVGFSGGIWILWNSTITTVQIVKGYPHFIHSKIDSNGDWFHLIVVYAPPMPTRRRQFWTDLEEVVATIHEPLFVGGDFNCILSIEERLGGSGGLSPDSNIFADIVGLQDLIDMGYAGSQFTWFRGNRENPGVAKRLDRIFSNVCGRLKWDRAMVRHLPATKSDHNPLYLMLDPVTSADQNRRPFRFEAMWFTHPNFMSLISDVWKGDSDTHLALSSLREDLRKWNREVFGNIHRRKDKILARLQGIENALSSGDVVRLADLRTTLKNDLDDVLIQEEIMWRQKSRVDWLACGDRNTTFFHTSTIVRRRRKSVVALRDTNANWIVDKAGLENMVVDYFADLYQEPVANDPLLRLPRGGFSSISHADLLSLMAPFSDDEIWLTVKRMGALKAPGIDGFQPVLGTLLAPTYLMHIASLAVGLIHGVGDSLRWAFTTHGDYSTKSAYCLLRPTVTVHDQIGRLYSQIWKIAVTERVRLFLWLGVRGRLLTNCERARRHLTSVATCGCCGLEDETTAKEVWALFLVNADEQFQFFLESWEAIDNRGSRTPPQKDEVRIKILFTSLCHTHVYFWEVGFSICIIIVESVGEGVNDVKPGGHVLPVFTSQDQHG
ncbi:hypothetical protein V2J09_007653 [Rumex salicifolius]